MAFLYGVGGSGVRSVVGKNGYFHYMIKPVFIFANRRTFVQNFLRKVVGRNGNTVRNVGDLVGKRTNYAVILFPVDFKHFESFLALNLFAAQALICGFCGLCLYVAFYARAYSVLVGGTKYRFFVKA